MVSSHDKISQRGGKSNFFETFTSHSRGCNSMNVYTLVLVAFNLGYAFMGVCNL